MPAQSNIDKLTVFEVVVTDATNEALVRNSAETRQTFIENIYLNDS